MSLLLFFVHSLCPSCLCGKIYPNHKDTEGTRETQRKIHFHAILSIPCCLHSPLIFTKGMKYCFPILAAFVVCFGITVAFAQNFDDLRSAGNGIDVDADGGVFLLSKEKAEALGKMMANMLEPLPESLNKKVAFRKISLKKLDAQVKAIVDQYEVLPDTIRYLGGLTSIEYIVAVPEENDLLLIGPAEGWRVDSAGNVVGNQSGLPVLVFEDFLTILRAWNRTDISRGVVCSIEPTPETVTKLAKLHQQFTSINANNADAYFAALEETYGNCPITITGVPAQSRFARVLVAADFKMKQIALGLEPSQARNIPSYVSLVSGSRPNISPRFWLVPEYAATTHDSKKLIWRLGDLKIRVFSNEDYLAPRRNVRATGGTDRAALNWCSKLEENYDGLAKAQPVFGELRNNMKLALATALIHQENLLQKANCKLMVLLDDAKLKPLDHPIPKSVTYRSVKSQNGYSTIVACGGIEINSLGMLRNNLQLDNRIDSERSKLIQTTGDEWWSQ